MIKDIQWSRIAEYNLQDIYDYYSSRVNQGTATKVVNEIIGASLDLLHSPYSGQKEFLLENSRYYYRYKLIKNYKIIYRIVEVHNIILIITVFDTRQSPDKLQALAD